MRHTCRAGASRREACAWHNGVGIRFSVASDFMRRNGGHLVKPSMHIAKPSKM